MRTTLLVAMTLIALSPAALFGASEPTYSKKLDQPRTIQGYPCAKTHAWFYADGRLQRCTVSQDILVGEITVPAQSILALLHNGRPNYTMLVRNTVINGLHCSGGGLLGPAEGAMTSFYPSGKFRQCFLTEDQIVQGVPCARGGIYRAIAGHDVPVEFDENGKLKSCLLTADYGNWHSGDRFMQSAAK